MTKLVIIGFSKPTARFAPFSWLIRLTYTTFRDGVLPFSHCYARFHSSSIDRDLVYQASGLQVNFVGRTRFLEHAMPVEEYALMVPEEMYRNCLQWCVDRAGLPYSLKQVFGIAWVVMNRWVGRKIQNPFSNGEAGQVCSELVGRLVNHMLGEESKIDMETAGPREIRDIVRSLPMAAKIGENHG